MHMNEHTIMVGRAINGISINGREFLLKDDGDIMEFPSVDAAKDFLIKKGYSPEEIEELAFINFQTGEIIC